MKRREGVREMRRGGGKGEEKGGEVGRGLQGDELYEEKEGGEREEEEGR